MIITLLINLIVLLVGVLFSWLPQISELPFGIDSVLVSMVSYYHGATATLPYLGTLFTAFLYVLLFEGVMLILKLFLGSRTPSHS